MHVYITDIVDCDTCPFRKALLGHEKMSDPNRARPLLISLTRRMLNEERDNNNNNLSPDTFLVYLSFCSLPTIADVLEGPLLEFLNTLRSRVREMRTASPYFCRKLDLLVAKGCIGDMFMEPPADTKLLIVV